MRLPTGSVEHKLLGLSTAIAGAEYVNAGISALIHTGTAIGADWPLKFQAVTLNV